MMAYLRYVRANLVFALNRAITRIAPPFCAIAQFIISPSKQHDRKLRFLLLSYPQENPPELHDGDEGIESKEPLPELPMELQQDINLSG